MCVEIPFTIGNENPKTGREVISVSTQTFRLLSWLSMYEEKVSGIDSSRKRESDLRTNPFLLINPVWDDDEK